MLAMTYYSVGVSYNITNSVMSLPRSYPLNLASSSLLIYSPYLYRFTLLVTAYVLSLSLLFTVSLSPLPLLFLSPYS